jgi:hypothetical protein
LGGVSVEQVAKAEDPVDLRGISDEAEELDVVVVGVRVR